MEKRLKRNTWLSKEHVVRTKILPYFKNLIMSEITPAHILKWQNEMISYKDENGNNVCKVCADGYILENNQCVKPSEGEENSEEENPEA